MLKIRVQRIVLFLILLTTKTNIYQNSFTALFLYVQKQIL